MCKRLGTVRVRRSKYQFVLLTIDSGLINVLRFLETTGGDRKAAYYIQISYGVTIYQKGTE